MLKTDQEISNSLYHDGGFEKVAQLSSAQTATELVVAPAGQFMTTNSKYW